MTYALLWNAYAPPDVAEWLSANPPTITRCHSERTDWFSSSVNPVRVGWYECHLDLRSTARRRFWNGYNWQYRWLDSHGEFLEDCTDPLEWRGLTQEFKE